ncbi:MAG: hypothetical protein NTX90_16430 [Alphaproteobacteria bacterium]|nr:hypothetical protein [Alphaproteobacteria bacterium]
MEIRRGLLDDPRWLAAAIGGIASAIAALWAMRGLPLGFAAFWLTSLPIFAAGLGFGSASAFGALCVGTLMVLILASEWPALIYLLGFALPALLMVATGLRGGRLDASAPLALIGIWPALVILLVAVLLADSPGGFDGALIGSVKQGLARMGIADAGMPVEQLARIMAPAMAGWMVAALIICGIGAQTALTRRGMALAATPLWRETRLPIWYGFLPGAAAVIWLSGMGGDSSLPLALFMVLLLPFFLLGLAAVHRRSAGRTARPFMLGVFYAGLVILSVPAAIAVTAFGIFEQWGRRNELPGGKT